MSIRWIAVWGLLSFSILPPSIASENQRYAQLRYAPECILQVVATRKGVELRSDVPRPEIRFASQNLLLEFQDEMENRYGWRPGNFMNLYFPGSNRIYLLDWAEVYENAPSPRSLDATLAHEFVHYLQVQYEGEAPIANPREDFLENEAVEIQLWFQATYMGSTPTSLPCGE